MNVEIARNQRASLSGSTAVDPPSPMKRLVLCLDGTWNTDDDDQITNVVHIRNLIDPKYRDGTGEIVTQGVYYERGVGTAGTKLKRIVDGATGGGLEDNVRGAYRFLSGVYRPGLELFIFGFSRGAFTARSLAGYIGASGLLKPEYCTAENERRTWAYYRTAPKFRFPADRRALQELSFPNVRIKLLAVFDTVGSRGIPVSGVLSWYNQTHYGFHDVTLGANVDHALHALAIDEMRWSFPATLWQYPNHKDNVSVEQVWFPGNHGNIGGGYPDTSLSAVTLKWMLGRIEEKKLGLYLVPNWRDRLSPNTKGRIFDETDKLLYSAGSICPTIRTINQCRSRSFGRHVGLPRHAIPIGEMIHISALNRMADAAPYAPPNLESAVAAIEKGDGLIPIVGNSGRPLYWFNNEADREELFNELAPSLRDRFANAPRSNARRSTDEEAKQQANNEVA